jgi:hypothetical protein
MTVCQSALVRFCNTCWPCEFQTKKGIQCENFKTSHTKGHQDGKGYVVGSGEYSSDFCAETYNDTWTNDLKQKLMRFERQRTEGRRSGLPGNQTELDDMIVIQH